MDVAVRTDEGWLNFSAPAIEVVRLVAAAKGFNVDVESGPAPDFRINIEAERYGNIYSGHGKDETEAANGLIKELCK